MTRPDILTDGPIDAALTIALAHGAGAPMDSPFMAYFAERLSAAGFRVVRFEFPYMAGRRATGQKRPPDRQPVLLETWRAVIDAYGPDNLIIGGKSMGGRMASLIADEEKVTGLICLGYPFHAPGKPDKLRVDHLRELETPALILQGERDPMGNRETVPTDVLSSRINLRWLPDGDHSLKPRKKSGYTEEQNLADAVAAIQTFAQSL